MLCWSFPEKHAQAVVLALPASCAQLPVCRLITVLKVLYKSFCFSFSQKSYLPVKVRHVILLTNPLTRHLALSSQTINTQYIVLPEKSCNFQHFSSPFDSATINSVWLRLCNCLIKEGEAKPSQPKMTPLKVSEVIGETENIYIFTLENKQK